MIQYYKSSLSKRFYYSKFLYLNTIIMALALFYIFASTTTLADAQNTTNSTEINALLETAKTLFDQKKYDEAIQNYDKALQIDPNNTNALSKKGDAFNAKGDALYNLGRYDEAIQYYDKALQIDPNNTYVLNSKGLALKELDRDDNNDNDKDDDDDNDKDDDDDKGNNNNKDNEDEEDE